MGFGPTDRSAIDPGACPPAKRGAQKNPAETNDRGVPRPAFLAISLTWLQAGRLK
jgi:hypothetical protein